MTNQWVVFKSHVHLCKPQYKSTGVDELLISCSNFWLQAPTQPTGIHWLSIQIPSIVSFHKYDKLFASDLYGRPQWLTCGFSLIFYRLLKHIKYIESKIY